MGMIINKYLRPSTAAISHLMQDKNQYGFMENMSYLLDAIQWYECQKHAQETKANCFMCTLDSDSAFEVVNRTIQEREIFAEGEEGALWQFNNAGYENTNVKF